MEHTIRLSIVGIGIIFYSPFAVSDIPVGENFLATSFTAPKDVASHVMRCELTTFCTGSGGDFELVISDGRLDPNAFEKAMFKIRLGLEVRSGVVCFRDLYDLMDWSAMCPAEQYVQVADGFHRITAYTSPPPSGIFGDNQKIHLHFEKVEQKPELKWAGVPHLC